MSFIENSLEDIKFKFSTAYHPQTDAQAKVVNKSLGNLLWCLVGDHVSSWESYQWLILHIIAQLIVLQEQFFSKLTLAA